MVKGKRWKKGQSSSSNPETRKYRDIAKANRTFFTFGIADDPNVKKSLLTQSALAELDANNNSTPANLLLADNKSLISDTASDYSAADTFKSWATNWSDCTNATFNKVHRYWKSNSALHKEILAVLAAITEVIKENDGNESETEYFAALMTGLDSVKDNEDTAAAFVYLIALAIKKVPETVLKAKFNDILKTFYDLINKYGAKANNVTLIKSCLMCMCWLLKSQDESIWSSKSTKEVYFMIMRFAIHPKPKIRKCGQEAVRLILKSCVSILNNTSKELALMTADYCLKMIVEETNNSDLADPNRKSNQINRKLDQDKSTSSNQNILYTLTLLKHIVFYFELISLKKVGECLLQLITLKDILVTSSCFQVFHQLFESQLSHLTDDLNGQMINAFYDYQPSENDPQQIIAWLAVLESSIRSLNRKNRTLCLPHLPHFFEVTMLLLSTSHHQTVHLVATNCLRSILEQCVQTNIDLLTNDLKESIDEKKSFLYRVFSHIEAGMSYQYHSAWVFVMKILACAFTSFKNRDTFVIVRKALTSLANLRESEQFTFKKEADEAIGRAIQTYGPKLMLDCIPLDITGDETRYDYPRSWMLPLLKNYTEKTELGFFLKTLLPLAKKLKLKSELFSKSNQQMEAKIFDTLQNQIWSLLPNFCDFATDFNESFKTIAKHLGELLEKQHDLRAIILQTVRTAIYRNTDENRAIMAKYAKNYLPILFNIYTTEMNLEKDPIRQSIVDTIKCYLKITDTELCNTYLTQSIANFRKYDDLDDVTVNVTTKVEEVGTSKSSKVVFDFNKMPEPAKANRKEKEAVKEQVKVDTENDQMKSAYKFTKYSTLDLIAILVAYSNEQNVKVAYELAFNGISNRILDKTVQKKSYKIFEAILMCGKDTSSNDAIKNKKNETVKQFIESQFETIANTFVKSLNECNAAAKAPRLRCLLNLMDYVKSVDRKPFLKQILPEVILCIREVNHKSRDASFQLLNEMARLWQRLGDVEIDALNEFFHFVMIGLAGSKNMISCSCLALSSLAFEFRENLSGSMIGELFETACLLVRSESENREILMASLNLLKILCSIFTQSTLSQYINKICATLVGLHEKKVVNGEVQAAPVNKSQRVRSFVKIILKKLMKKFSYEIVFNNMFEKKSIDEETSESGGQHLSAAVRQSLENLLANLKKLIEKEKQRKLDESKKASSKPEGKLDLVSVYTTAKAQSGGAVTNEVEELLKESSSEDEDEEEETAVDRRSNKSHAKSKRRALNKNAEKKREDAWLQENENEDPLDLLDPMAMKRVLATKPLTRGEVEKKKAKQLENKNRGFKMSSDGRLMIEDDSDESDDDKKSRKSAAVKNNKRGGKRADGLDEMMDTLSLSKKSVGNQSKKSKKKSTGDDNDSDSDIMDQAKSEKMSYKAGGSGIHRKLNNKHNYGSEYKAKKARGDIKLKNKPDPYAFIPFNYGKLNKRKKAKLQGEFKGVVKAVKRAGSSVKSRRK